MYEVIIIGGGPAGSTTGALLARAGHSVLILEKERFPRFHVGESLLPAEMPVFDDLDFDVEKVPGLYKAGAEFIDESTGDSAEFPFAEGMEGTRGHAWQVERAPFDEALLRHAEKLGAEVREGVRVRRFEREGDEVVVETESETLRARFVIDATGRDRLGSKQARAYERIDGLGVAAVFGHFTELSDAACEALYERGNIKVLIQPEMGWAWVIPLAGRRVSVGFVSAKRGVIDEAYFHARVAESPLLLELTEGATLGELTVVGDYSYRNTQPRGERWGSVGDAMYFLDPVFSSGVALAMASAEKVAEILSPALREGREGDPELLAPLEEHMKRPLEVFGAVVWSFYHTGMVRNLFFYDDPDPALRAGLISVLAGDVWREDNPFQKMILRSRRRGRSAEAAVS